MKKQINNEALEMVAARFRLLSDPMRLRILHALEDQEMSVSLLVKTTGGGQANISKHLGILHDAGVLGRRKEGLNTFYRVTDETIFELCKLVCDRLEEQFAASQLTLSNRV